MPDINDLRQRRYKLKRDARAIVQTADEAGRDMTVDESREFYRLLNEADELSENIEEMSDPSAPSSGPGEPRMGGLPPGHASNARTGRQSDGLVLRTDDGQTIRAAEPHESLSDVAPLRSDLPEGVSLGRAIIASITGDWSRAPAEREARDLMLESDPSGGYLLTPAMSGMLIDQARANTVLVRAGARTVPLTTASTRIATVKSDPAAGWVDELDQLPDTDMTFGQLDLAPKTLGGIVTMSQQLAEDAPNAGEVVERVLADAVAVQLDDAFLNGVAEHPWLADGVLGHSGVNTVDAGLTALSYDHVLAGMRDVEQANGSSDAAVFAPRDQHSLSTSKDLNDQYLQPPSRYEELRRRFSSTQMPTTLDTSGSGNDNESKALVGNLTSGYVLLGTRRELRIEATRVGDGAFETLAIKIRIHGRFDIAVGRPSHLTVIEKIVA